MPSTALSRLSIQEILADWDTLSIPGLCAYCADFCGTVLLPFHKGKPSCNKCFRSICYGM